MAKLVATYENLRVKLVQVRADSKNARKVPKDGDKDFAEFQAGIKTLADDMKTNGQQDPLLVIRTDDVKEPYEVKAGTRRRLAALLLEWEEVDVRVIPFKEDSDIELAGLANNLDRKELTPYETASKLAEIKRDFPSLSDQQIATRIGRSKSGVQNMLRLMDNLHPKILRQWEVGNGKATTDNLLTIVKEPNKDEQWRRWQVLCGALTEEGTAEGGEGEGEGDGTESNADATPKRNAKKAAQTLLNAITADKEFAAKNKRLVQALQYVLNTRKTLPEGITLPKAETSS